jgi:hypothetical protein
MKADCFERGKRLTPPETEKAEPLPLPEEDDTPPRLTPEQEAAFRSIGEINAIPLEDFATVLRFEAAWELLPYLHTGPLKEHRWAFRGQASADWKLEPSIERLQRAYFNTFKIEAEGYVRRAFKRRAHHYMQYLPGDREELEWMALMRHHGAPTRLLDWTRSPYVAAFFAIAEASEGVESAIWAIDIEAVKNEAIHMLNQSGVIAEPEKGNFSFSDPQVFDQVFLHETSPAIVAPVQPLRTNERATSQQGLFLCPNPSIWGFEFALKQLLKSDRDRTEAWCREHEPEEEPIKAARLFKLCIAPQARRELLRELYRMNINYATLFPGLDGFARSLGTNITVSGFKYAIQGDYFDSLV